MVTRIYYVAVAAAVVLFGLLSLGVRAMGLAFEPTDTASVITVTSTDDIVADDGVCTLREAITAANTDSPSGGIAGECPTGSGDDVLLVLTGTYSVAITGTRENNNATGDFDILNPVTILATGPVTLAVNEMDRAFQVLPTSALTISGFTITNAHAPDGYTDEGSGYGTAGENGGTFLSEGNLTVLNSILIGSSAGRGGNGRINYKGLPIGSGGSGGHGGAIAHIGEGNLIVVNSNFPNSAAGDGGDGGGSVFQSSNGGTAGDGGGLYLWGSVTALVSGVRISGTHAGLFGWPGSDANGYFGEYGLSGKGGAIAVLGNPVLTVMDSTIINASNYYGVGGKGGGIYNEGSLIVESTVISGSAAGNGRDVGLESPDAPTVGEFGGGLYNNGNAILRNCVFEGNRAGRGGSKGENGGSGVAGGMGGGIYHDGPSLTISECLFTNNAAGAGGVGYNGGDGGAGGAITVNTSATITASIFFANTGGKGAYGYGDSGGNGGDGGALFATISSTLLVKTSSFYSNTAGAGDIIFHADGGNGGAIMSSGSVTVSESTFSHNRAGNTLNWDGGNGGDGGAIFVDGNLRLSSSTVAYNDAGQRGEKGMEGTEGRGGGIYSAGTVIVTNTIIANNSAPSVPTDTTGIGADCFGAINSGGYLLVEDDGECTLIGDTTGNIIGQDPMLAPLADNGGPTFTHAFDGDSPAIDAGFCTATEDQRGYPRPIDLAIATNASNACDIGAFERQAVNVHPDMLAVTEGGIIDTYTLSLTLTPTAPVTITLVTEGQLLVSPDFVVFGTTTWSLPQTITVSGIDDTVIEGLHTAIISHTVASDDPYYDEVAAAAVQVSIMDNDLLPTATATATSTPLSTSTVTPTASNTPSPTHTVTTTVTGTATRTPTVTHTPTGTGTATPSGPNVTPTPSTTATPTTSATATISATATATSVVTTPTVLPSTTPIGGEVRELYLPLVYRR